MEDADKKVLLSTALEKVQDASGAVDAMKVLAVSTSVRMDEVTGLINLVKNALDEATIWLDGALA